MRCIALWQRRFSSTLSSEQRIARMDRYLLDALKDHGPLLDLLETIPGVDRRGAAMLLVEIGTEMSVFGSAERIASWVGICPGNNESAGKRKSGRIRRGNPWIRRLLEFAQAAARTRCPQGQVRVPDGAQGLQEGHRRPGPQDAAHRTPCSATGLTQGQLLRGYCRSPIAEHG